MGSHKHINNAFYFNSLKHHLGSTKDYCKQNVPSPGKENTLKIFAFELQSTGNNITDIYTGALSINNIFNEIYFNLKESDHLEHKQFISLLKKRGYHKIEISDGSIWIIRLGKQRGHYIHVHPARIGEHTVRFAANAWKTAILCYYQKLHDPDFEFLIGIINVLRTNYLELSPIKKLKEDGNICVAYNLLCG